MARGKKKDDFLVFIDTNIYLDFYRASNEAGLKLLGHLNAIKDRIISTYQVEMEFKKNRQKVILETMNSLLKLNSVSFPAFLIGTETPRSINKRIDLINKQIANTKKTIQKALSNPTGCDPVYKQCQKIFKSNSEFNLTREKQERFKLRRLARKRFILGYPPRKDRDLSIGDAINWEWIIACSEKSKKDIVIVSRDEDYGETFKEERYINDWLSHEFRDRVSLQRKVILTSKLTVALKHLNVTVSAKERKDEIVFEESLKNQMEALGKQYAEGIEPLNIFSKQLAQAFTATKSSLNISAIPPNG